MHTEKTAMINWQTIVTVDLLPERLLTVENSRFLVILLFVFLFQIGSANNEKEEYIKKYRTHFSQHKYRGHSLKTKLTYVECVKSIDTSGAFIDLSSLQKKIESNGLLLSEKSADQHKIGELNYEAFNRIWLIAEHFRGKTVDQISIDDSVFTDLLKAICNYGELEVSRANIKSRFLASCFGIPTAAVNTYFALLPWMEQAEGDTDHGLLSEANKYLKQVGMQSWTQPYRGDATDKNVVDIQRFRHHVWWVGGNAIAYRSLLPAAVMMQSIEMLDVISEVAQQSLSSVSHNTYDEAFWNEGFTADGAGWGHGRQCLVWGYPIHGGDAAMNYLNFFKESPWAGELRLENRQALLNFLRGSSWYYYKGYETPAVGRQSMLYYQQKKKRIPSYALVDRIIDDWLPFFTDDEQKELLELQNNIATNQVTMSYIPKGYYQGTRWFYSNDNLIKKTPEYYYYISMASSRCDGIESAYNQADGYNFFTCDGMTLLQKEGNEYLNAIGGWNLSAIPGVTNRQNNEPYEPIIHWSGFCSKHNFAGASTRGGQNAVAGYVFEKMNAYEKKGSKVNLDKNKSIYGVKAHKFYFMFDDYLLALGAGISNTDSQQPGDIWTTIDQTENKGITTVIKPDCSRNISQFASPTTVKKRNDKSSDVIWISHQGGFAYGILSDQTPSEVCLLRERRAARWEDLNHRNKKMSNLPDSTDIFQLWINHGRKIKNDTYGYLVSAHEKRHINDNNPVKILSNTVSLQAACNSSETVIGASFYKQKATLKTKQGVIKVSDPCVVLIEIDGTECHLTVNDPTMNNELKSITLKTTMPVTGENVKTVGRYNHVEIPLPQGEEAGKPSGISIKFK